MQGGGKIAESPKRPKTVLPFIIFIIIIFVISGIIFTIIMFKKDKNTNINDSNGSSGSDSSNSSSSNSNLNIKLLQRKKNLLSYSLLEKNLNIDKLLNTTWYVQIYIPTTLDGNARDYTVTFTRINEKSLQMQFTYKILTENNILNIYHPNEKDQLRSTTFNLHMDIPMTKLKYDKYTSEQILSPAKFRIFFFKDKELWVTLIDPNYEWLVLTDPKKKYLWVLSKQKYLQRSLKEQIISELKIQGYNSLIFNKAFHS